MVTETNHVTDSTSRVRTSTGNCSLPPTTPLSARSKATPTTGHSPQTDVWSRTLPGVTPKPLSEVAGIAGYVSFYDEKLRVVVVEQWPDGTQVPAKFPIWGDADELVRLVDVDPVGDGQFVGPAHGPTHRDVVEGGQLLAEAIVATSKTIADQRVTSASMVFAKAASFGAPVDLTVEMLRSGRSFDG